jgi:WD40 repeat protein
MVISRSLHTATLLPDERVLIAGGLDTLSGPVQKNLSSAEVYQPGTGTFVSTGNLVWGRSGHTATLLPDGDVLIAGGFNTSGAEIYHPPTGSFTETGSMLSKPRAEHTATLLTDGRVLVAGGAYYAPGPRYLDSARLYEPSTRTFTSTGNLGTPRAGHTATLLTDERVLITGDEQSGWGAEIYTPATGTFTSTGRMAVERSGHTATLLPDGRVLVAGGGPDTSAEIYTPATGTFTSTGRMAVGRRNHTATLLTDGRVLVAGGTYFDRETSTNQYLTGMEIYDPLSGTWSSAGDMVLPRYLHTATLLPDGHVLITGGRDGNVFHNTAEMCDPLDVSRPLFPYQAYITLVKRH